jgi:hypothetical protein
MMSCVLGGEEIRGSSSEELVLGADIMMRVVDSRMQRR